MKSRPFRLAALAVALLAVLAHARAPAAPGTIFAVLVADTDDAKIGAGCGKDVEQMAAELKRVESQTGMAVRLTTLTGKDATREKVEAAVKALAPAADDV